MSDEQSSQSSQGRHKKNTWKIVMFSLSVAVVLAAIAGVYYVGYKNGEKQGEAKAQKEISANPLANLTDTNRFLPKYKTGEIVSISKDTIILKTSDNKEEKISINDKTKVTKKTDTISLSSLKKGDKITAFIVSNNIATRIVYKGS